MTLSERQQKMLEFIRSYLDENDRPPTIREIGEHVGISSTSVVNYNLNKLQEGGFISRNREVSRGLHLADRTRMAVNALRVPIVGRIAAGQPIHLPAATDDPFAGETIELTRDIVKEPKNVYALQVRGDSMIDASVHDGDYRGSMRPAKCPQRGNGSGLVERTRRDNPEVFLPGR